MKGLIGFILTIVRMVVISAIISAIFSGIQWLLSLAGICSAPTWDKFIWGGLAIFAVWFIFSAIKTGRIMLGK